MLEKQDEDYIGKHKSAALLLMITKESSQNWFIGCHFGCTTVLIQVLPSNKCCMVQNMLNGCLHCMKWNVPYQGRTARWAGPF